MSDLHRKPTDQKARKEHRCVACGHAIPTGETYKQQTGFFEGSAYRNRYHNECFEAVCDDGDWSFSTGDYDPPERLRSRKGGPK